MGDTRQGVMLAIIAYGVWGVAPLYFKWVASAGSLAIVSHRVLWAIPLLIVMVSWQQSWSALGALLQSARQMRALTATAILISINWLVFVYAVESSRIVEASLGYFINPLVSVLFGMLFLAERPSRTAQVAICVAAFGVVHEVVRFAAVPWLGLALAFSFGGYGLVRKQLAVPSHLGLLVETSLLAPVALLYLLYESGAGEPGGNNSVEWWQLAFSGLITTVPLVCFAAAALRLPLYMLGLIQYLAPSLSLGIAVLWFGEPFAPAQWISFGAIWCALVIFSWDSLYHRSVAVRAGRAT